MKLRTTRKEITQNAHKIVSVGYCEAQNLLRYRAPFAYTAGVYGWNADFYEVGGVVIATGYRGLPANKNTKCDYATVREWDNKAADAKTKEEVEALLTGFIAAITK